MASGQLTDLGGTAAAVPRLRRGVPTFTVTLTLVALIALAVRVAYAWALARHAPLVGDAHTFHLLAERLADGQGYVRPRVDDGIGTGLPTAEFPPLYPFLLAVLARLGAAQPDAQRVAMCLVGTATVVGIGLLARHLDGEATGITAAMLAASYPMLFQPDGALMSETLYAFVVVVGVLLLATRVDGARYVPWLLLGIAVGLAALVRGEALALLALLVLPLALAQRTVPGGRRVRLVAVAVAGTCLVVGPWITRNLVVLNAFVPISNNVGGALIGANCPQVYDGRFEGLWLFSCYDRVDTRGMDEAQTFRNYRQEGLRYAREHADRLPRVMGVRLLRTWGAFRPDDQVDWEALEGRNVGWQRAGMRMYWVMVPLAAVGAFALRRRGVRLWPLLSTVVLVSLTALATYGNQRFRVAAEPTIVVLSAAGLVAAARAASNRVRGAGTRG